MNEPALHRTLVWAMFALAALTALALTFLTAPYGRHARGGWGPMLSARVAWVVMECPSVFLFLGVYLAGSHRFELAPLALLAVWQAHYAYRGLVYPFRLPASAKPMPASIALTGTAFNVLNSYVNARWISEHGAYPASWLYSAPFVLGVAVFFAGMALNRAADRALLNLRKPGEKGYKIPRGPLYELISCPNYLGEILEWFGWAIATWSLSGLAFAVYTVANLAPRAVAHHHWYLRQFPDYPPHRKALIPFVL